MSSLCPRATYALISVLVGCFATSTAAFQSSGDEAPGTPGSGACSYLDLDLVKQVSGSVNPYVFDIPPEEEPAGAGSACTYATIVLQIDAFSPSFIAQIDKSGESGWKPVSDIGDRAYFRDNRGYFAEIAGSVANRTFTIQMGVPHGSTVEAIKPNVITLGNAIVAKLK